MLSRSLPAQRDRWGVLDVASGGAPVLPVVAVWAKVRVAPVPVTTRSTTGRQQTGTGQRQATPARKPLRLNGFMTYPRRGS